MKKIHNFPLATLHSSRAFLCGFFVSHSHSTLATRRRTTGALHGPSSSFYGAIVKLCCTLNFTLDLITIGLFCFCWTQCFVWACFSFVYHIRAIVGGKCCVFPGNVRSSVPEQFSLCISRFLSVSRVFDWLRTVALVLSNSTVTKTNILSLS